MLTHHEGAADEERWQLPERDPVVAARLREAGVPHATGSLDREREVAKGGSAWLAFIFRAADRVDATVRRILRRPRRDADEIDDLEAVPWTGGDHPEPPEAREGWKLREADPAMDEWLRSMGIRPGRYSLDHPRPVMNQLPAWLAIPLNRLGLRR